MNKGKKRAAFFILLILIPVVVLLGAFLFREKHYAWIALCVAVLSVIPFFYSFEKKESSAKELAIISMMIALSVAGRFLFAPIPGFKPITALTVITALHLGKESGFVVGSLSALVSNFYFGQGPWTPFQMFAWGLIGFLAGILSSPMRKNKPFLSVIGALFGVLYSLTMDVWTVVWADGAFNLSRYLAAVITSLPICAEYALSNVVFLLLLTKPIGEKLDRIKKKYGLFLSK